jgi:hypothetical protein
MLGSNGKAPAPKIPILLFADSILGIQPYDWQCKILLNYEAGFQTAAACANFTGKTSTLFPIALEPLRISRRGLRFMVEIRHKDFVPPMTRSLALGNLSFRLPGVRLLVAP